MVVRSKLTHRELYAMLAYDPDTGAFVWRERKDKSARWNARFANRPVDLHYAPLDYVLLSIDGHKYPAEEVAFCLMTGAWSKRGVTHRSSDICDNRWSNLRELAPNPYRSK